MREQPTVMGLSKEQIAYFPLLSFLTSTFPLSNSCHSTQLTAVITGQQSMQRFKLPLPLNECPLYLTLHLSCLHCLSLLFSLFFSVYPSLLVTDGNLFVSLSHIDIRITSYISVKENHWAGHACSN